MPDLIEKIYDEVVVIREQVSDINARVAVLETRANGVNGFIQRATWTRSQKLFVCSISGGWALSIIGLVVALVH